MPSLVYVQVKILYYLFFAGALFEYLFPVLAAGSDRDGLRLGADFFRQTCREKDHDARQRDLEQKATQCHPGRLSECPVDRYEFAVRWESRLAPSASKGEDRDSDRDSQLVHLEIIFLTADTAD